MKFGNRETKSVVCVSEDGGTFELIYHNRGEPYREGACAEIRFNGSRWDADCSIYIDKEELIMLRNKINEIFNDK